MNRFCACRAPLYLTVFLLGLFGLANPLLAQSTAARPFGGRTIPQIEAIFTARMSEESPHPRVIASRAQWDLVRERANFHPYKPWIAAVKRRADLALSAPLLVSGCFPHRAATIQEAASECPGVTSHVPVMIQSRAFILRTMDLAFMANVTADPSLRKAYADRVYADIQSLFGITRWDTSFRVFLIAAEIGLGVSIAYDWLYDYWMSSEGGGGAKAQVMADLLGGRLLQPSLPFYADGLGSGWGAPDAGNWGLVCNGAVSVAAVALGRDATYSPSATRPAPARMAALSAQALTTITPRYAVDGGGWFESPAYWQYGFDLLTYALSSYQAAYRTDFGFSLSDNLHEAGAFAAYVAGPRTDVHNLTADSPRVSRQRLFNYADSGTAPIIGSSTLLWWAQPFLGRRELYSWWAYASRQLTPSLRPETAPLPTALAMHTTPSPLDLLWFVQPTSAPPSSLIPGVKHFAGASQSIPRTRPPVSASKQIDSQDVVVMRTSFTDDNGLFVGFKAGRNGEKHGQLDIGSFVFDAFGQRWIEDLGSDQYNASYFQFGTPLAPGSRWSFYRATSEGNNTIVLGEESGPQQDINGRGEVLKVGDTAPKSGTEGEMFVVSDITNAYTQGRPNVKQVMRGLKLNKRDKWLLVQDVVALAEGSTEKLWSTFHFGSYLEVSIAPDGRRAVITNRFTKRALVMVVRSPDTRLVQEAAAPDAPMVEDCLAKPKTNSAGTVVPNMIPNPGPDRMLTGSNPHPSQLCNRQWQRIRVVTAKKAVPWSAVYLVPLEEMKTPIQDLPPLVDMRAW